MIGPASSVNQAKTPPVKLTKSEPLAAALGGRHGAAPENGLQHGRIDRLDEMMIEAGFTGATQILILSVTRDGYQ
jgi:hypothetical protein